MQLEKRDPKLWMEFLVNHLRSLMARIAAFPIPTIAALNGTYHIIAYQYPAAAVAAVGWKSSNFIFPSKYQNAINDGRKKPVNDI